MNLHTTSEEQQENLTRLNIDAYQDLVGKMVYYSRKSYGKHLVVKWDANRFEYLLDLDGQKFWCSPFSILLIN